MHTLISQTCFFFFIYAFVVGDDTSHDFLFCLQVANAAKMGASAVLIYPDPTDYPIGDSTQLFGHVSDGGLEAIKSSTQLR